jgi:hypothetical protein
LGPGRMTPQKEEFYDYLLKQIERKDQRIYDLQYEMETLLSSDDELLRDASDQIVELKSKCAELIEALRTSLEHLERISLQMTSPRNVREFILLANVKMDDEDPSE